MQLNSQRTIDKDKFKNKKNESSSQTNCQEIIEYAQNYLSPWLSLLEAQMDKRLIYTFFDLFIAILMRRDRANGLILSELGGYVNHPSQAAAGTKRISNLLRSENWSYQDIQKPLKEAIETRLSSEAEAGRTWLMVWDDSVLEKPESWRLEGLCSVRSSKGKRLTRIKPGFYQNKGSICVPGFEWSAAILTAQGVPPQLCLQEWWTTRGQHRDSQDNIFYKMLKTLAALKLHAASELWHIFDRGYANANILRLMFEFKQQFIIRWKTNQLLINELGEEKATYRQMLGQPNLSKRKVWDKERKQLRWIWISYRKVKHSEYPDQQLYLIIVRCKNKKQPPMYLLTNVLVDTPGMAWEILFSYIKRWEIEQVFRFGKTALALESPRVWFFQNRLKLLHLVTLVLAFLLQLVQQQQQQCLVWLDTWCPRKGNWQKKVALPLYRLRLAIAECLSFFRAHLFPLFSV